MEEKAKAHEEGHNLIVTVLSIILLFGIIALILHSMSSHDESSQSISSSESTTNSFTYVVSISMAPLGSDSTEVRIEASRTDFEDGNTLRRTPLSNKYLNYSIFDAIDEQNRSSDP